MTYSLATQIKATVSARKWLLFMSSLSQIHKSERETRYGATPSYCLWHKEENIVDKAKTDYSALAFLMPL